jgi:uncharacterized protein
MFGISFSKVVVLVAVVAIVWFGYRWFQRWDKERREAERREAAQLGRQPPNPGVRSAEEMTACRVCGTYVAPAAARSCGRPNCPFPRA